MNQTTALFGPIVEVRDVLESFLRDGVLVADWRLRLDEASRQLRELDDATAEEDLAALAEQVTTLVRTGLAGEQLTRNVAGQVQDLLAQVRVPNLPRPEDEDWGF